MPGRYDESRWCTRCVGWSTQRWLGAPERWRCRTCGNDQLAAPPRKEPTLHLWLLLVVLVLAVFVLWRVALAVSRG